jgi:hypothetical protein
MALRASGTSTSASAGTCGAATLNHRQQQARRWPQDSLGVPVQQSEGTLQAASTVFGQRPGEVEVRQEPAGLRPFGGQGALEVQGRTGQARTFAMAVALLGLTAARLGN